jgi:type IV secretory pathway TraG/TraD family ATPase VirD4
MASVGLLVPVTAIAGVAAAGVAGALRVLGMPSSGLSAIVAGAGISAATGYLAGRLVAGNGQRDLEVRRGTRFAMPRRPRRKGAEAASRGLSLAGIAVPAADEIKHFKLMGATGTGKSSAIAELMRGALGRGDRAIIADPDGGYLRQFYRQGRGDLLMNPFESGSHRWDLFGELREPYDVQQLARSLIPDQDGSDRNWRSYARTFLTAVTQQAQGAGIRDIAELYRLLVVADARELRELTRGTPAQPFLHEDNSRMFDSIRSVTSAAVGALEYVATQHGPSLSVRQWVREGNDRSGVLFIPYRAGQIAALRSTVSAWMRLAIFEAMEKPEGDQRLWFVVDELDAIGAIDGLKDALARLRKFGGRCVLGFQSIAQVSGTYGNSDARTLVENCGNSLILRCSASEGGGSAAFASALIGQREVMRASFATTRRAGDLLASHTRSEHIGIEPAILSSEIEQLPDRTGFLKLASHPEWLKVVVPVPQPLASGASMHISSGALKAKQTELAAQRSVEGLER